MTFNISGTWVQMIFSPPCLVSVLDFVSHLQATIQSTEYKSFNFPHLVLLSHCKVIVKIYAPALFLIHFR